MNDVSREPTKPVADPSARSRAGRFLLGLSLVLVSFNLRPIFSSLSAVLPEAVAETGAGPLFSGLATTLPVLCLGLFAPLAPILSRRIGPEWTVFWALVLIAAGTGLRGIPSEVAVLAGQVIAGAAIAVGNVLLPGLVKRDFPGSAALMTGLYTMALCGGAATAAGITVPINEAFGSWSLALAAWALPAAAVGLLWTVQLAHARTVPAVRRPPVRGLWRDPLAWQVTLFMGLQSSLAYCVFGWLAPILRDRGLDGVTAGFIVSVSVLIQTVSCLAAPNIAARLKSQSWINVILLACAVVGLLGCLYAPLWSIWFWAVIQGLGQGSLIAVAMTVIVLRSPDPWVAAQLSSMAQTVGYILAAGGPLLVGLLHAWSGGFAVTGILFAALGIAGAIAGFGAGRPILVRPDPTPQDKG
ncbi:CynX/NimT family MFS transporter [Chthonobacter albigriseus]|uniref:CynX/NimT family MFS transporter n=1 Tax=Chthonobacter albigriseus TaxID=1683161 RepID=UPI0015EF5060|nr:CynX/NimT family MFS transporter [Chthonobacter albigriseus]